jgi:hypothetical protein
LITFSYVFYHRNWAKTEQTPTIGDIFWEFGKYEALDDSEADIAMKTPPLKAVMRKVFRVPFF